MIMNEKILNLLAYPIFFVFCVFVFFICADDVLHVSRWYCRGTLQQISL